MKMDMNMPDDLLPEEPEDPDEFWRKLGIRPPQNKEGGPPVDETVFEPLFNLRLSRDDSARVFWLISEFRSWNQAYGKWLRDLQREIEQSN